MPHPLFCVQSHSVPSSSQALLEAYYNSGGSGARIVLPKGKQLQQRLASHPKTADQVDSRARHKALQGRGEDYEEEDDNWEFF